jgi:hypothetical protein
MRFVAFLAGLAVLSGCGGPVQPQANADADEVVCAIGPGSEFRADCRAERVVVDGEEQLVVRHPDGSFRRFVVDTDGGGVTVADGADAATQELADGTLEVAVAGDRYRFPTRAAGGDAPAE